MAVVWTGKANVSTTELKTDRENAERQCRTKRTSPQASRLDDVSINASAAPCAFAPSALLTVKILFSRQEIERPTGATLTRVR